MIINNLVQRRYLYKVITNHPLNSISHLPIIENIENLSWNNNKILKQKDFCSKINIFKSSTKIPLALSYENKKLSIFLLVKKLKNQDPIKSISNENFLKVLENNYILNSSEKSKVDIFSDKELNEESSEEISEVLLKINEFTWEEQPEKENVKFYTSVLHPKSYFIAILIKSLSKVSIFELSSQNVIII